MTEKMTVVTEKVNHLNRRTIAIILTVALVLSVFAGTGWFALTRTKAEEIHPDYDNLADAFDYYLYLGNHYTKGEKASILMNRLNQAPPAEAFVEDMNGNFAFQTAKATWVLADWVVSPVGETIDAISEYVFGDSTYYEAILLKMLVDTVSSNKFISIVNNKDIQSVLKIKKSLGEALDVHTYKEIVKSNPDISALDDKQKEKLVKWADGYVKSEHEKWLGKDYFKDIKSMISSAKKVDDFYKKLNTYMSLQEVNRFSVAYLQSMLEIAKTNEASYAKDYFDSLAGQTVVELSLELVTQYLHDNYIKWHSIRKALDDLIFMCTANEAAWLANYAEDKAVQSGKKWLTKYLGNELRNSFVKSSTDGLFDLASGSIALNTARITIVMTKTIGNLVFSTDATLDKYKTTECIVELEKLSSNTLKGVLQTYDWTPEKAATIIEGIDFHYKLLQYDRSVNLELLSLSDNRINQWLDPDHVGKVDNAKKAINETKLLLENEYNSILINAGDCNDTVSWVVSNENDLYLYGYGEMPDYISIEKPWKEFIGTIRNVYISSSITKIGASSLNEFDNANQFLMAGNTVINEKIKILDENGLYIIGSLIESGCHFAGRTMELLNDIDLSDDPSFSIGCLDNYGKMSEEIYYAGSLDGQNHKLSFSSRCLFYYVKPTRATYKNVTVEQKQPNNHIWENYIGLFGLCKVSAGDLIIENIHCIPNVPRVNLAYSTNAGAIAGKITVSNLWSKVIFRNCTIDGLLYSSCSAGGSNANVGGLVGVVEGPELLSFYQCSQNGTVKAQGYAQSCTAYCGAFVGRYSTGNRLIFEQCASKGQVLLEVYQGNCGGLVGKTNSNSVEIANCEIFSYIPIGEGLIGDCRPSEKFTIRNTYCSCVLGNARAAFIYGATRPATIENCYFDTGKTPGVQSERLLTIYEIGKGNVPCDNSKWSNSGCKASEELKTNHELYKDWDFDSIWKYDASGYPMLRCFSIAPCSKHVFINAITAPSCTAQGYTTYTCEDCHYSYRDNYVNATGHAYRYTKTVEPSCTTQGYDLYTCSVCNATERRNAVSALGHTLTDIHTVAPTCTAKGYEEGVCSVCGATVKQNYINATGHDNEVVKIVAPTCTEKGYTEYKCKTCGTVTKGAETVATGHSYISQVAKEATCTEDGVRVKTCETCGDSYEETISKLGHNFTWASNTHIAPTCTAKGYTVQTCSRCGETQQVNELPATGHDYGDVLGAAYIATIYDANHRFKDSLAYTPNTVTANTIGSTPIGSDTLFEAAWMTLPREIRLSENDLGAVEEYYLSRQRQPLFFHSMETKIPAAFAYDASTGRTPEESALPYTDGKGNLYVVDGDTITVSLLKEEAREKGILNDDGTVNVKTAIAEGYRLAYSAGLPGTYIILPELEFESMLSGWNTPTSVFHYDGKGAASPGVYTVNYCFYNEKRSGLAGTTIKVYDTDALNHKTLATAETPAQLHRRCIDCGEELVEDIITDGELKIRASSLSLGNNLIMNFKVSRDTLEGFDEPYVEVLRNGKTTRITSFKEQGDDCVFSFENIAPQTMNDELSATLYATKEGALYGSNTLKTSVRSYVEFLLDNYSSDKYAKLRTLIVDLLDYGAVAQEYRNYKTDALVNAELTSEQKSWASGGDLSLSDITDATYETVDSPAAKWSSVALILDNAVTVRYKFTADDISGMSIKVQYGNTEKEFDSSHFESLGGGTYGFKFSELSAHQMQVPLYATIYKDGEAVSNTFAYNVESYAARVKQTQPNTALGKLTDALMRYGFSATKYKNS